MKKQIVATLVLFLSVLATAHAGVKKENNSSTSKTITLNTGHSFSKLVVEGNVDVVLYENDAESEIRTFGNRKDLAATRIVEKDGVLTISNSRSSGEKVFVYVPVKNLRTIEAKGDSKVSSAAVLPLQQLTLVVKGTCQFNIRATGNIDVVQDGDVDMLVEKNVVTLMTNTVKS